MSDEEKTAKSEASPSWIGFLLPPLVVIAAGFLWVAVARQDSPGGTSLGTRGLRNDGVYYVHISQIELYPTSQDDEAWDSGDSGAPDIRYRIVWQGNTIHESATDDNTLIAEWSGVSDGTLDKLLGEEMLKAAQIRALKDGKLTVHVEDVDTLTPNDPAGTVELEIMELREGANDLSFEKTKDLGIKRMLIRMVSKDQSIEEIVRKLR